MYPYMVRDAIIRFEGALAELEAAVWRLEHLTQDLRLALSDAEPMEGGAKDETTQGA